MLKGYTSSGITTLFFVTVSVGFVPSFNSECISQARFKSEFIFVISIDRVWLILCHKDTDQIIFLTMVVKDGHMIQGNHFE